MKELSSKILSTLSLFLGLPHVHVRKTTASKLYEALILHGDACDIPEENLDEVSSRIGCLNFNLIFRYLIITFGIPNRIGYGMFVGKRLGSINYGNTPTEEQTMHINEH